LKNIIKKHLDQNKTDEIEITISRNIYGKIVIMGKSKNSQKPRGNKANINKNTKVIKFNNEIISKLLQRINEKN
jgi:hypothetical protein